MCPVFVVALQAGERHRALAFDYFFKRGLREFHDAIFVLSRLVRLSIDEFDQLIHMLTKRVALVFGTVTSDFHGVRSHLEITHHLALEPPSRMLVRKH